MNTAAYYDVTDTLNNTLTNLTTSGIQSSKYVSSTDNIIIYIYNLVYEYYFN